MALIDDIISDMALLGDAQPVGQSPSMLQVIRAVIAMGHRLHSDAGPDYWYNGLRSDLRTLYLNQGWWEKLQSWFVLKRTSGSNRWANVELQLKDVELLGYRQSLGAWVVLGSGNFNAADYYPTSLSGLPYGSTPVRNAMDGGKILTPSTNETYDNIHGYGPNFIVTGIAYDITCLHFRFKGRLIKKDPGGADDISTAKLILTSGLDVYPGAGTSVGGGSFDPIKYVPPSGQGRYKWVTGDWALYSFTSVKADYDPLPSRPVIDGTTVATNAQRAATETWLRAHPPPFAGIDPGTGVAALNLPASAQAGSVVRARFVDASGSPISGATVSWQGASGGVIYNATTNDQGVSAVRVTATGSYTLTAAGGGVTATATATITVVAASVTNAIITSETPTSWTRIGSGHSITGGQVDVYGGTRWGLFTMGAPSGGDPSGIQVDVASMLSSGRISGECFVKKGNQNWVALYVFGSTGSPHASARGWFNINDGTLGAIESLGVGTNAIGDIEPWGDGFYRISLSAEVTGGGGSSMLMLRVDTGNQAYAFPSGGTVTLGGGMLHLGPVIPHQPTNLATTVMVNPATLPLAQTGQPYAASVTCSGVPPITWSISSGSLPAGITADTGQTSTTLTFSSANVTATSSSTFTVSATDGVTSDSESFTIPVGTPVAVSPAIVDVPINGTQQFVADVAVTWAVAAGSGSIDGAGLYTAPAEPGGALIRATKVGDANSIGTAEVSVVGAPGVGLVAWLVGNSALSAAPGQSFSWRIRVTVDGVPFPGATVAVTTDPATVIDVTSPIPTAVDGTTTIVASVLPEAQTGQDVDVTFSVWADSESTTLTGTVSVTQSIYGDLYLRGRFYPRPRPVNE